MEKGDEDIDEVDVAAGAAGVGVDVAGVFLFYEFSRYGGCDGGRASDFGSGMAVSGHKYNYTYNYTHESGC